jgi:hypothetical protein
VLAITVTFAAAAAFEYMRRRFKAEWDRVQVEIEDWLRDNPDAK